MTAALLTKPHPPMAAPRASVDIDALAWEIERVGLVGHEAAISDTVDFATTRPVSRVLVDVLGDTGAPDVVRIRAFGKLVLQLARQPR